MAAMLEDKAGLFLNAYDQPNPASGTSTTWTGHADDLKGRLNRIQEGIALGETMGCDMSQLKQQANLLSVPWAPERLGP